MKTTSAFGPDRIGPRVLQEAADILCRPLSIVFMRSLDEGVVPEDWKKANITPIFKSGSRMVTGNSSCIAYMYCMQVDGVHNS